MRDFKEEIAALLAPAAGLSNEQAAALLEIPPDRKLGDYAFPCFRLGKNAPEEAAKLKANLKLPGFIAKVEIIGPYLNFFLKPDVVAEVVLTAIYQQAGLYGKQDVGKGKKVVIDFSSPNIAKPFSVGHLRSTVIGGSLYRVYESLGYKTIGVNHLGDWGTQFGKLIVAYKRWGDEKELEKEPVQYLLQLYVRFHQEAEKDPALEEEARQWFKKLEDGDKEALALWEDFRELSLEEFKRIYQLLDVTFDSYHGEAFYNNLLNSAIRDIKNKVNTEVSDGALIVPLETFHLPPLMLQKSDEASTYATRDLAAVLYRLRQYKPFKIIYVVGAEQKLHFQQLFKVLELAGVEREKLVHVDFGLFKFPEGKMSTRKGNVIFLEEVLNKSIALARQIIEEKNPGLKNKEEVARAIGVGAILFADLSTDRVRDVDFDWNKFLSFEGETGPYLQYTHARACSLLRKAKADMHISVSPHVNFGLFSRAEELAVAHQLAAFPDVVIRVATSYRPHHLAHQLISLAQAFNDFYHQCPVLTEEKPLLKARLLLVDAVRQVLENGLHLLGIKAPEEM